MIPKEVQEELKGCKRVFVQFPEGLKTKIWEIKEELEKLGLEVILDFGPTYGFCDLKDDVAISLNCDCLLHIGHNTFGFENLVKEAQTKVVIWEYRLKPDKEKLLSIVKNNLDILKGYKRIGLVASLQYLDFIPILKEILESFGFEVIAPKIPQILGCNVSTAKAIEKDVEAFLVPTTGRFYILGLLLETEKRVFSLDLEKEKIEDLKALKMKYLKIIYYYLSEFDKAKKIAILISWKKGQRFYDISEVIKKLRDMNKEIVVVALDEIDQAKLEGLDVDFYVNLACPRIFDGYERFNKPILNWKDLIKFGKI